jgi:hypothetical protein
VIHRDTQCVQIVAPEHLLVLVGFEARTLVQYPSSGDNTKRMCKAGPREHVAIAEVDWVGSMSYGLSPEIPCHTRPAK